jgi:DNA-binding XRE family transcriptional regulator
MPRYLSGLQARRILTQADLRGLRTRAGISLATLGEALGVSHHTACNWERRRGFPRGWTLIAYARVIGGLARHEEAGRAVSSDEETANAA